METDQSTGAEIGCSSIAAVSWPPSSSSAPPTSSRHQRTFDFEEEEPQFELGYLYEIDHTKLRGNLVQLDYIRVALVCEKTKTKIAVRFPSRESLVAFFRYSDREMDPILDERILMGTDRAQEVFVKLVLPESYTEQKEMESFWLVKSMSIDDMFKDDNEISGDEEDEEEGDTKINSGIHINKKGKVCHSRNIWPMEWPLLKEEARRKIGFILMHMEERSGLGNNERFKEYNPDRPMDYWQQYADHVGIRKAAGISDPYWDPPTQEHICDKELKMKDYMTEMEREFNETKAKLEEEVERLRREVSELTAFKKRTEEENKQPITIAASSPNTMGQPATTL